MLSGQARLQALQGMHFSGSALNLRKGLRWLNQPNIVPNGHMSRQKERPVVHSMPIRVPNQPIVGKMLPPVPAAIAPRQTTPAGQMAQKMGVWHTNEAPITPPITARCIQVRTQPGLELAEGPRLKIQRPGHIQLQKARPKMTINKTPPKPPRSSAGMILRVAAIT